MPPAPTAAAASPERPASPTMALAATPAPMAGAAPSPLAPSSNAMVHVAGFIPNGWVTQANNTPNFCSGGALACRNNIPGQCLSCGGAGQPCCDSGVCNNGGCCQAGTCIANNGACMNGVGQCRNNSCGGGTCGVIGQPC